MRGPELKAAPWSLTSLSCPLGTVGSSSHETLTSELVSHETIGRWSRKQAGPSHTSSWAVVTQGNCAPCGAGLSASAQDPLVLVKSSAYTPRMTEGEILIGHVWCRQGDTINYRVKRRGLPWWRSGRESACQCRGHGFEPWSGKIPHAAEQLGP